MREWVSNYSDNNHNLTQTFSKEDVVPLLGILWDRVRDELFCYIRSILIPNKKITKRHSISVAKKIFGVIGITCPCPVILLPKILLLDVYMKMLT